jgi:predicted TIM-barrel fold metal-dependent hydrolase
MTEPALACDAHMHVFDPTFAYQGAPSAMVEHATAADYLRVQGQLGTRRTVVVTPRIYGTDNAVTLDAIIKLGKAQTRGVAVVRPEVTDAQLERMHEGGIRGIRFTLYTPEHAVVGFDMLEQLSHRVAELGWHVQLHWTAEQIVAHRAMLERLPSGIVFDHLARLPVATGTVHPAFGIVRGLLDHGRTWLKLSGPYLNSVVGEQGAYADSDLVARAWVRAAPARLVWGSDWPHITERPNPPSTALMGRILARWVDDEAVRQQILVGNPAELYDFDTEP